MIDFYQVWHNDELKNKIAPSAKYLQLDQFSDYRKTGSGLDIQEYKIYQIPDEFFESDNQYIGFTSARWSDKFPNVPTVEYILNGFKASPLQGKFLFTFITAQPHWIEHMNYFHRGMLQYVLDGLDKLNLKVGALNNPALPMCNSYICRKETFFEIKQKFNFLFDYYEQTYQHKFNMADNGYGERILGCFYERIIMGVCASLNQTGFTQPMMAWQWP